MTGSAPRDIVVLSLSTIRGDGRILRQIDSLLEAGCRVWAISPAAAGHGRDAGFSHPRLTYIEFPPVPFSPFAKARVLLAFLAARLTGTEAGAQWASRHYPGAGALQDAVLRHLAVHADRQEGGGRPFLIAHDWMSLGAAQAASRHHGLRFHYDCHEASVSEHAANLLWRLVFPPVIAAIEASGVRAAASTSTVSGMILRDMSARYSPAGPILLIRNIPDSTPLPPNPTGERVEILFHGLFKPDRQIVELVRDVANWPLHFVLRLRGHAPDPAYARLIAEAAAALGGRVRFEALAPLEAVQALTATSDIGVCLHDTAQAANRLALPNKLFEYLYSGLMMLVPEASEMAELVEKGDAGIGVCVAPLRLGPLLATLDRARIDHHKAKAHALAQTLSWDSEIAPLLRALGLRAPQRRE